VLTRAYPHKAEQSKALGIWAAISSIALPAGPILGGALVDTIGWRWVFLVNLPVVVAAFVGVLTLVSPALAAPASAAATGTAQLGSAPADADVSTTAPRLDPAGMVLVPLTLGALVWSVIAAGQWLPVAVAVAAAGALVLAERRAKAPLLPHGLLNRAEVLSPNAIAFVMNVVTNGTLLIVTLFLQQVRGFSALNAGFLLLFLALPLAGLAAVSGRLTATFGPRLPAVVGVLLGAAGALTLGTIEPRGGFGWMLAGLVALGAGDGFIVTAAVAAAMQAMPPAHAGLAGGLNNTARQLGTAFGVAVFGAVSGPATEAGHFVRHVHRLAWIGAAAWLVALALTRWIGRAQEATTASRRKISQPTASRTAATQPGLLRHRP
jgi:DHA2 family methylenomycin A resistance protein-like MFS transporter